MTLSVCTLAHGRADHLVNLVHGLNAQTVPPAELVIAVMQAARYDLPETAFPVRQILLDSEGFVLSAARNVAARAAVGDKLVFLDVDCIPTPELVADYDRLLDMTDAILMGEVLYLPKGAVDAGLDFAHFAHIGVQHRDRAGPPETLLGACSDYRCFWSLNFAVRKAVFFNVGGFDEGYLGYGGEDTDFGKTVATAGGAFSWCRGARAYHQYHPHHMPPVHHIDSVIANAARFRDKWGHFTMEHWLRAFELMGLIALVDGDYVRLREVSEADLALTRQQAHQPYASTATLLAELEARASSAAETAAA
ncbi:MAG: galactosyltransferase-related protein [Rhizorhabdus sp.]